MELSRVKKNTACIQVGLGALVLDCKDPIRVHDVLAQFVQQAEVFVTLPNFLCEDVLEQFRTTPTSVQFLLRVYATDENIGQPSTPSET